MKIGPYEVGAEIGRGGMGFVYEGRAPDGARVAIKVLRNHAGLPRFERERRLLARLGELEGFVALLDAGQMQGQGEAWISMPFLQGGTLRDRLKKGVLPVDEAVAIVRAVADAMGRAHALGVVHRDLKPENILFDAKGAPFIADLGLAKHFRDDVPGAEETAAISKSGSFRGTPSYMPPEQMTNAKSVGPAADVYALGAILYEALVGDTPFTGRNVVEIVRAVVKGGDAPRLRSMRADVPPWLDEVVARALAKKAEERFHDAAALGRALAPAGVLAGRRPPVGALVAVALLAAVAVLAGVRLGPATKTGPVPPVVAPTSSAATTLPPSPPSPPPPPQAKLPPGAIPEWAAAFRTSEKGRLRLEAVHGDPRWRVADSLHSIAVVPSSSRAFVHGFSRWVQCFDLGTGDEVLPRLELPSNVSALALSTDGSVLLVGLAEGAWAYSTAEPRTPFAKLKTGAEVVAVLIAPDAKHAVTLDTNNLLEEWILPDGKKRGRMQRTEDDDLSVAAFVAPRRLLVASSDGKVSLVDLAGKKDTVVRPAPPTKRARGGELTFVFDETHFALTRDRKAFVVTAEKTLELRDAERGALIATFDGGHKGKARAVAISAAGDKVLSSDGRTLKLWSLAERRALRELPLEMGRRPKGLAFAHDDQYATFVGEEGMVHVVDLVTGVDLARGARPPVHRIAVSADGARGILATSSRIERLDLASGSVTPLSAFDRDEGRRIVLSGDGTHALVTESSSTRVEHWDLETSTRLHTLTAQARVTALALSPDGRRALTGEGKGRLILWDLKTGEARSELALGEEYVNGIAFAPSGERAFVDLDQSLTIVNIAPRDALERLVLRPIDDLSLSIRPFADGMRLLVELDTKPAKICAPETNDIYCELGTEPSGASLILPGEREVIFAASRSGRIALARVPRDTVAVAEETDVLSLDSNADRATAFAIADGPGGRWLLVGTARGLVLRYSLGGD